MSFPRYQQSYVRYFKEVGYERIVIEVSIHLRDTAYPAWPRDPGGFFGFLVLTTVSIQYATGDIEPTMWTLKRACTIKPWGEPEGWKNVELLAVPPACRSRLYAGRLPWSGRDE